MKLEVVYKNAVLTVDDNVYFISRVDRERLRNTLSGFKEVIDGVFKDYEDKPNKFVGLNSKSGGE